MCRKKIIWIFNESNGIGRVNCDNPSLKSEIASESVDLDLSCVCAHVWFILLHHLDHDNQNLCADAIKRRTNAYSSKIHLFDSKCCHKFRKWISVIMVVFTCRRRRRNRFEVCILNDHPVHLCRTVICRMQAKWCQTYSLLIGSVCARVHDS